jgi:hypothetical protein
MSWFSSWFRNRLKAAIIKMIPYFAEQLDNYVDEWIDKKQESEPALQIPPIKEFVDDFQQNVMTPQTVGELLTKGLKKI